MKIRRRIAIIAGLLVVSLTAACLVLAYYAFAVEPYLLAIHRETLSLPHWSRELNGLKVVALSDIHGDRYVVDEARIRLVVNAVNSENPDIIFLLGDYVSEDDDAKDEVMLMPIEDIAKTLKGLKAKYGVYAVIGNHDWWYNEKRVRSELEKNGIRVLENEIAEANINNQTISIVGIEDFWKHHTAPIDGLLAKIDMPKNILAITHNPDSFDFTSEKISLVMAGHTHGGQVSLPIVGPPITKAKREYTGGHIVKDGRNLFVTTGIGISRWPLRFGVPPEIAVLTLNSAD